MMDFVVTSSTTWCEAIRAHVHTCVFCITWHYDARVSRLHVGTPHVGTILYIFRFGTLTLGTDLAADWQNPASNPLELHVCYSKSFIQHSKSSKFFAYGAFLWWSLFSVVHPRRNSITNYHDTEKCQLSVRKVQIQCRVNTIPHL